MHPPPRKRRKLEIPRPTPGGPSPPPAARGGRSRRFLTETAEARELLEILYEAGNPNAMELYQDFLSRQWRVPERAKELADAIRADPANILPGPPPAIVQNRFLFV
jgi:hypothetical protein